MDYIRDLEQVMRINSYTKNKAGVDAVGELFDGWMAPLGYEIIRYEREQIGRAHV